MTQDEIGSQWVESPCGTPWLFKNADAACAAYNRQMAAAAKPQRGMGEVTTDNLMRIGVAIFCIGAGFIIVSGQMEQRRKKRSKRR